MRARYGVLQHSERDKPVRQIPQFSPIAHARPKLVILRSRPRLIISSACLDCFPPKHHRRMSQRIIEQMREEHRHVLQREVLLSERTAASIDQPGLCAHGDALWGLLQERALRAESL